MKRERFIPATTISGQAWYSGTTQTRTCQRGASHRCIDEDAAGQDHYFRVEHITKSGGLLSGSNGKTGIELRRYQSFPLFAVSGDKSLVPFTSRGDLGLSSDAAYASKLLAQTNPSRPDVDIPVFVAELKDLPSLVYREGGNLLRRIAKYNLKYQFGIRPLVSDLLSMLDWVALVEKRKKELEALAEKGLRRRRLLDRGVNVSSETKVLNSDAGVYANVKLEHERTAEVHGFVRWFPAPGFPNTDASLLSAARRAVFGLTIDGATAWELIPFSWLIDWYGSIGTYLMATRNIIPCSHSIPLVMPHYKLKTSTRSIVFDVPWLSCSSYVETQEYKNRALAVASPLTARLPFLTGRQLSILASLFVVRGGRYR